VGLLSVGLVACATQAKYQQHLSAWQGRNIQEFVDQWGYPDRTITALDGNQVYVYQTTQITSVPVMSTPSYTQVTTNNNQTVITQTPGIQTGGGVYSFSCTTWVEFNKDHLIVKTSFRGNGCVST
jgi:hypothetical protein